MKKGLKGFLFFLLFIITFLILYFIIAIISSNIQSERVKTRDKRIYKALILSNGVHTDIVLPVKNKLIDWRNVFPVCNTRSKNNHTGWVAFGWGDKGFYLNTPTWGDLTFSTAIKAVSGQGGSALHVTYRDSIKIDSSNCISICLTRKEFISVGNFILKSTKFKRGKSIYINTKAVYGDNDAFYESKGKYHLFNTCNTWTNDALKSCNQKACVWTPFESGIFDMYKK